MKKGFLLGIPFLVLIFSCGKGKKSNVESTPKDSILPKPMELNTSWTDEVYADSTYQFELIGAEDSITNTEIYVEGGTAIMQSKGKYDLKVGNQKDTLRLYIDRRIMAPETADTVASYKTSPFRHLSVPIRKKK